MSSKKKAKQNTQNPDSCFDTSCEDHLNSTNSLILTQGKKRTETAMCHKEGETLYWYDFDEFDINSTAIPLGTHAQHCATFP